MLLRTSTYVWDPVVVAQAAVAVVDLPRLSTRPAIRKLAAPTTPTLQVAVVVVVRAEDTAEPQSGYTPRTFYFPAQSVLRVPQAGLQEQRVAPETHSKRTTSPLQPQLAGRPGQVEPVVQQMADLAPVDRVRPTPTVMVVKAAQAGKAEPAVGADYWSAYEAVYSRSPVRPTPVAGRADP